MYCNITNAPCESLAPIFDQTRCFNEIWVHYVKILFRNFSHDFSSSSQSDTIDIRHNINYFSQNLYYLFIHYSKLRNTKNMIMMIKMKNGKLSTSLLEKFKESVELKIQNIISTLVLCILFSSHNCKQMTKTINVKFLMTYFSDKNFRIIYLRWILVRKIRI